jgi:hypothetical protein
VRVLRRTNSESERVRILATLDGIARRPQIGASHGLWQPNFNGRK